VGADDGLLDTRCRHSAAALTRGQTAWPADRRGSCAVQTPAPLARTGTAVKSDRRQWTSRTRPATAHSRNTSPGFLEPGLTNDQLVGLILAYSNALEGFKSTQEALRRL